MSKKKLRKQTLLIRVVVESSADEAFEHVEESVDALLDQGTIQEAIELRMEDLYTDDFDITSVTCAWEPG